MSVREEERRKNACPSRGLGLAAAAIGVGVGAALYYFLSKRPEQQEGEAPSTEASWERPQTLNKHVNVEQKPMEIPTKLFKLLPVPVPRERKWSLEECAICFEIMLQDQQLMSLPCTHHFHVSCIGPWLQERQTCPVCRKPLDE